LEATDLVIERLGEPGPDDELDRVDNNGHYELTNLRWASRAQQMANRSVTRLSEYDPQFWPYEEHTVRRLLSEGFSREEILARAEVAVKEKRKGWHRIQARLLSMTYSMPDHVIVSPRRIG